MESALPPTIQMLLAEFSDEDLETRKLHDRFRDSVFVRELKDQAKYSLEKFVYADDKPITNDAFLMYAGGGLNPLGTYGKCSLQEFWMDNTLAFSRLAGLYANLTLIPDPLSSWMSPYRTRQTNSKHPA